MPGVINPRTGLNEIFDERLGLPIVQQRGVGTIRFGGQSTAVHTIPLGDGMSLDFYARLRQSDELVVTFHGANHRDKNIYPMFARIRSLRRKATSMMAFADPTIMADPEREMLLSWYLGGPGWDPLPLILRAVKRAQGKTGAKHVAFLGGSGGGFAALRASAMVPGSMAFVQEPQTSISAYHPSVVDRYFTTVWPGWDYTELLAAFPERFDMVRHYNDRQPDNFVYYVQSRGAPRHHEKHYAPFAQVHGDGKRSTSVRPQNRVFVLYDGEKPGHGKITAREFDHYYAAAMKGWRAFRAHH